MDIKPMNTSVSSAMIKGESYSVMNYEEYRNSKSLWDVGNIAVQCDEYVLPYRGEYNESSMQPGIYNAGSLDFKILPNERDESNYKNIPVITISSNDNIQDIINKENVLAKLAEPWITNPDNITVVNIKDTDEPSMKILKQAINSKRCDIDKYASRFGDNFPNDKRQLKNDSVTLKIINRFCENLDMEAILTIKDKEPGVPNPMKEEISISLRTGEFLTGGKFGTDDEEELDDEEEIKLRDESSDEDDVFN